MVAKAVELAKTHGWFLTRQFENEANADIHSRTTAREILEDFKGEKLDYWVTGYGTGGTLKGVARVLAKERPDTKIVVCEPEDAPLLGSGIEQARNPDGSPAAAHPAFKPHPMQGWTPDFIPKLTARRGRHEASSTASFRFPAPDAMRSARELAPKEGIFVGITAGRDVCRRAAGLRGGAEGREHPVHAARHRRALSEHAAVRRRAGRHDAGGAGDLALDAERAVCRGVSCSRHLKSLHGARLPVGKGNHQKRGRWRISRGLSNPAGSSYISGGSSHRIRANPESVVFPIGGVCPPPSSGDSLLGP